MVSPGFTRQKHEVAFNSRWPSAAISLAVGVVRTASCHTTETPTPVLLFLLFTGSKVPVPGCFYFFTGSRVPSLAVSISSRPFGTCLRRSGHRMNNLLNTLTSDEPPRHDCHACGRPHTLELAGVPTIYSHSLNSSAPAYSWCRDSFKIAAITAAVIYFQEYSQVLQGNIISLVQPGYPLLCRCTKSAAPPQY